MKTSTEAWAFASLIRKEKVINPKPQYQRGAVWGLPQKQLLIDSILRDMDIPKLYLREISSERYKYEVIDGQQRLRSIWEFCRGDYSLAIDADNLESRSIAGLLYEDLPEAIKDDLDTYQLTVVVVAADDETEIEEMFLRLQNGTTLKAAEKRNAISGPVRDYIRNASKHNFFQKSLAFKNDRFSHDAVAAQMLLLELNKSPSDIKDKNLEQLYKDDGFSQNSEEARHMKRTLDFLYKEFDSYTPDLKKAVAVSMYFLASDLLRNYNASQLLKKGDLRLWFEEFEKRRAIESSKTEDEYTDTEIVAYTYSLAQGTNSADSIKNRHEFLIKEFLIAYPAVEPKDPIRGFSESQRIAVYRRDGGICAIGKEKVDWENFAVDHIVPHARGGKTTLANAQLVCTKHNQEKGARVN